MRRRTHGVVIGVALVALASACLPLAGTLGSVHNQLGRTPSMQKPPFWLNIAGPQVSKAIGDRFDTARCEVGEVGCSPEGVNLEQRIDGAFSVVSVSGIEAHRPLVIRAFDPAFVDVDDLCDLNLPSDSTVPSLAQVAAAYPQDAQARARYAGGATPYCSGDVSLEGPPPTVTFIVRAPDATTLDDTDNPIICAISFSPRDGAVGPMLVNPDGTANTTTVGALDHLPLSAVFRQDVPICTIPAGQVTTGSYLVQVRANAFNPGALPPTTMADPTIDAPARASVGRADLSINTGGQNRYSLTATWGSGPGSSPTHLHVFARVSASIFLNSPGLGVPNLIPLATEPTDEAGHTLIADFWDLGDWGNADLAIVAPPGLATAPRCAWSYDGIPLASAGTLATATGCTVTGLTRGVGFPSVGGFNGRLLRVAVTLPADYQCASGTTDCLFSAKVIYTSGVPDDSTDTPADTTTVGVSTS